MDGSVADIISIIYTLMPKQVPQHAMRESIAVLVAAAYMHTIGVTQQGDLWARETTSQVC